MQPLYYGLYLHLLHDHTITKLSLCDLDKQHKEAESCPLPHFALIDSPPTHYTMDTQRLTTLAVDKGRANLHLCCFSPRYLAQQEFSKLV